jgi:hypothetical protein
VDVVGRIRLEGNGIRIDDGQIAGRVAESQIAATLGQAIPCGTKFSIAEFNYCSYLDVPSDPSKDGKGAACDAISIGFSFDLGPTTIVGLGASPALQVCDGGTDAALPSCQ